MWLMSIQCPSEFTPRVGYVIEPWLKDVGEAAGTVSRCLLHLPCLGVSFSQIVGCLPSWGWRSSMAI